MMKNYIGVDLGGTNIRIARFDNQINLEEVIKIETAVENGIEQIIDKIVNAINQLKNEYTSGVGISVPGQVDVEKGIILVLTNISLRDYPIGEVVFNRTGLKVILNNDANVAGLGEAIKGTAADVKNSYYITWSTGIGGALIIDNKLVAGNNLYSGEIGNIIIWPNDEFKHSFMAKGAVEGLTSGTAIKRYANDLGYKDAGELIGAAKNNDTKALEIIEFITDNFARLIATITHVVEVDKFVLGGGVVLKSGEFLIPYVQEKLNNYLMPIMHDKIVIEVAQLGDDAGITGSAFLAKNYFTK
jgi:glucokinase